MIDYLRNKIWSNSHYIYLMFNYKQNTPGICFCDLSPFLFYPKGNAQNKAYKDSLLAYQENYINTHESLGKEDKKFIHFYDIVESYRAISSFKKLLI